jgi:hypothetical protein
MDGIVGDLVTFSYMVAFSVGADPSCEGCDPTYYSEKHFRAAVGLIQDVATWTLLSGC